MPSTIARNLSGADGSQLSAVPPHEPETAAGPIDQGLQILLRLVGHIEKPKTLDEERCALLAVKAIHSNQLNPQQLALSNELDRSTKLVGAAEVEYLMEWVVDPEPRRERWLPSRRTRPQRLKLLFILLAKAIGRVHDFRILNLIQDYNRLDSPDQIERDLSWLPRWLGSGEYLQTADLYLDATQQVLFEDHLVLPQHTGVGEFNRWSWPRQIMHLRCWRESWLRNRKHNPAHSAARLEYRLARARRFSKLARRGGRIARKALADLGYRDHARSSIGWPRGQLLLAAVLGLACFGCWLLVQHRSDQMVQEDRQLIKSIYHTVDREAGHE